MRYGYARVSTTEQDETRQVEMLIKAGVEKKNITIEKKSGIGQAGKIYSLKWLLMILL